MPSADPVYPLADAFVEQYAALVPLEATFAGVEGHDHRWGDLGPEGLEARTELLRRTERRLASLPEATDDDGGLARRVFADLVTTELDRIAHDDHLRDLAHLNSTVPLLRDVLDLQDSATAEGRHALVQRLESLPDALEGFRHRMAAAIDRGALVPVRQVDSVVRQLRACVGADGAYPRRVASIDAADAHLGVRARAALPHIAEACLTTATYLSASYRPLAPTADGVGRARYLRAARALLGADLDPQEASDWAWDELTRVTARATAVAERIDPGKGLAGVVARLQQDPAFATDSPEHFRTLMLARQEAALDRLADTHFDVPAAVRSVEVRLAPPGGAIGAYYVGPSEDFSRPGSIWWSLADPTHIPLFEEISTAYHEGFPGHHLQAGVQMTLADRLSRVHRLLIWYPGYGEGWALYAETLMDELGALERPEYELGYLTSALLRLVRVVVDLGLHLDLPIPRGAPFHPGEPWHFDLAVEALETLAGVDHDYAVSEVTRYLGWPGQAITYALGQRCILELRATRQAREGRDFDLKRFHADVLGSGPVGLDLLRERVLRAGTHG